MFVRKPKSTNESFEQYRNTYQYWGMQLRLDLADMIISKMREEGVTQAEFADRANWKDSYVSRLIHADANCTFEVAARALFSLGIKPKLANVDAWNLLVADTSEIGAEEYDIRDITKIAILYTGIEGTEGHPHGSSHSQIIANAVGRYDAVGDSEIPLGSDVAIFCSDSG